MSQRQFIKPFDFGADPDHNPHPGILTEFLPFQRIIMTRVRLSRDQQFLQRFALSECS